MLLLGQSPLLNIFASLITMFVFTGCEISRWKARGKLRIVPGNPMTDWDKFRIVWGELDRVITLCVDVFVDLVLFTTILTAIAVWGVVPAH